MRVEVVDGEVSTSAAVGSDDVIIVREAVRRDPNDTYTFRFILRGAVIHEVQYTGAELQERHYVIANCGCG